MQHECEESQAQTAPLVPNKQVSACLIARASVLTQVCAALTFTV